MQYCDAESPAKVLLADDHTMFRQDLANGLGAYGSIEVVAQTNNDERAVALACEHKPILAGARSSGGVR